MNAAPSFGTTDCSLLLLEVEITTNCNRNCDFCYLGDDLNQGDMPLRRVEQLLLESNELGIENLILTGGEALLHPEINSILDFAAELGIRPGILTNGTPLSRDHQSNLKDRVSFIQISLHDLPDDDCESAAAVEVIEELTCNGVPVTALITLSATNIDKLPELLDLLDRVGVPAGVQRFCSVPGQTLEGLKLDPAKYDAALDSIWERLQLREKLACEDPIINRRLNLEQISLFLPDVWSGCSAGRWAALVTCKGALLPCAKLRVSDRNVFVEGIGQAWATSPLMKRLRQVPHDAACAGCFHLRVCRGCRADAFNTGAGLWGPDPMCPGTTGDE